MSPPPDDERLLESAASGSEDAFVELYRRHHPRVFRFAFRMTGSPEAAEDITHACFIGLLESPGRFRGQSALGTYLCAAARNQCLKRIRRVRFEVLGGDPPPRADLGRGPLGLLLQDEEARLVRDAVLALAPLHREVVILAELEGLDLATVAAIVGAEVGAVKVRLHRARKKLRQRLERYMEGNDAPRLALGTRK
jgi:RNA polymerase sigma-70 factor (ECF subfamily)